MGFTGKEKSSASYLFTGLVDATVKFINPDLEQLQTIIPSADKEPEYTKPSKKGDAQCRIDIWYEIPVKNAAGETYYIHPKESIYIQDKVQESTATPGSCAWLNDKGQTKWAIDINAITDEQKKWFDVNANPRMAKMGEVELYDFLVAWSNIDQRVEGAELVLDTPITDVINGDFTELQAAGDNPPFAGRKVRILLGIRSDENGNNYQDVYNRVHMPAGSLNTKRITKAVFDKQYPWKSDFQGSLKFQPFDPLAPTTVTQQETLSATAARKKV